ncbi:hypothetical protein K8638_01375 [Myxococcus sp. RHST-1-4]|nr:hypothetical protein [Myxococcus sp. RHSTA-1-4]MBZ4415126.1 hypothetical protein [Myxococcus sp. RHSTA-1-4]
MLVLIPVFLYALFLDDLLRHVLDAQEAALSTIWDYTVQDYAKQPQGEAFAGFGNVQGHVRQMYCDHESGIDSYEEGEAGECGSLENHHHELVSHACWLNPGSEQVQCTLSRDVGELGVSQHQSYMDEFGKGGLIRCTARLGVQNYLLQRKVFAQFSKVDLARDKKDRGSGIHANAQGGTYEDDAKGVAGDVYLLPWERSSIVTDTWALTEHADIRPGTAQGELYDRVLQQYEHQDNPGFTQMQSEAVNFVQEAIQDELLAPSLAITDSTPPGDDPRKPSIAIKPHLEGEPAPEETITQQGSSQNYFNSEWQDWDQDNNKESYQQRGNWYMGCNQEETC